MTSNLLRSKILSLLPCPVITNAGADVTKFVVLAQYVVALAYARTE